MTDWWNSVEAVTRFNNWMQVLIVVFGVLAAVATAMTILASNRVTQLQKVEAGELERRLKSAEDSSQEVGRQLKITTQELTAAEEAIKAASSQAAEAQASAEESKRRLQPRTLSGSQRNRFIALLKEGPSGAVKIMAMMGDPESIRFGGELERALKDAGWQASGVGQGVMRFGGPIGVLLHVRDSANAPLHAGTLQRALAGIGIEAPGIINDRVEPGELELIIGHKQ